MKKILILSLFLILIVPPIWAENNTILEPIPPSNWFEIPVIGVNSPLTLNDTTGFLTVAACALVSYGLSEWVFKDGENLNFYQFRLGTNQGESYKNVISQNFGLENRVSHWFAFSLELNSQQWIDRTPGLSKGKFGMGLGINSYFRWYLFGNQIISPYLEYGAGLHYGLTPFPYNGTNFTFNLSTQLGIEITLKNKDRIRIGYGNFHQSNNNLASPNPGYDGNGLSISWAHFWKTSKW